MKNVLLVFGGESYEHDISVVTASQIYNKTKLDDVKFIPLYVSRDNVFYVYKSKVFDIKDFSINNFNLKNFKEVTFVLGEKKKLFAKTRFGLKEFVFADAAIFACHGGMGENGELVSLFKNMGIGVSAGTVSALSVCMNKNLFKQVMKGLKVPAVSGFKITKFQYEFQQDKLKFKMRFFKFPLILKSNNGGSSIGLFVAKNKEEFDEKIKQAFEFDDEVLIEKYVEDAREFNVALVGNSSDFVISEIDEPLKENEILSFADKYLSNNNVKGSKKLFEGSSMASSMRKFPADIESELSDKIKMIAKKIFVELELSGVVRIDFLYQEKTGKLYVCEVNAIPGSLAYYFFKENKISTNDLVKKLIAVSEKNKKKISLIKREYLTTILE